MKTITRSIACFALVAAFGFAGQLTANADVVRRSYLSCQDFVNPGGYYYEVRYIWMRSGVRYRIDLTSTDFDTYLYIEDATTKRILARDDDGGQGLNSRIFFSPTRAGWHRYRVRVTSFRPRTSGRFVLLVSP